NLLRLGFLCEHRDDPLPCVSSVQVPRPRCASSPAALLPPRANSNRMLCPDPPPGPAASATLSSDRHCRGDSVEVSLVGLVAVLWFFPVSTVAGGWEKNARAGFLMAWRGILARHLDRPPAIARSATCD